MKKKYIEIVIFLIVLLTPFYFAFSQTSNAGFIPGNIWYSKDPFEEGDKIKIYTLIYNPDPRQLSGTVFFFDKTTFLGNKTFTIPGKGLQDISIDWVVSAGDHLIFAQIQNAKFLTANNVYENVSLLGIKTSESKHSVPKKIIQATSITNTNTNSNTSNTKVISDITNAIKENTPSFVSETISTIVDIAGQTTNNVEDFRKNIASISSDKKNEIKSEIKNLETKNTIFTPTKVKNTAKISPNNETKPLSQNTFLKPFKYAELFALSLFSSVFNNKYIFYGFIVIVIFFILRYIVRKIF